MRAVYLAGPYRGKSKWAIVRLFQITRNILIAWVWAYRLNSVGIFTVSPHLNSAFMDFAAEAKHWLNGDLELIRSVYAYTKIRKFEFYLGLLPGWEKSRGTLDERDLATKLCMPIYLASDLVAMARKEMEEEANALRNAR